MEVDSEFQPQSCKWMLSINRSFMEIKGCLLPVEVRRHFQNIGLSPATGSYQSTDHSLPILVNFDICGIWMIEKPCFHILFIGIYLAIQVRVSWISYVLMECFISVPCHPEVSNTALFLKMPTHDALFPIFFRIDFKTIHFDSFRYSSDASKSFQSHVLLSFKYRQSSQNHGSSQRFLRSKYVDR